MKIKQLGKKWLCSGSFILACFTLTTINAQKVFVETNIHGHKHVDVTRAITDTLDEHFDSATVTLYASPNGGFVGGNTGFGERTRAQEFDVDTIHYYVDGFIYWFGYKDHQSALSDSSLLKLRFWSNNLSVTIGSQTRLAPGTQFDSTSLYLQDMTADTLFAGGANVWMLTVPKLVIANYSVGFSMEKLHFKDTISVMMSSDGDPPISYLSWERWNNSWDLILNTWGLDADYAIFPLINSNTTSIENEPFVQGIKYTIYPNPSVDWMNVEMDVQQKGEYSIYVHDLHGRLIKSHNVGQLDPGRVSTSLEVFDLASGNYILTLTNGKNGVSKKFVKQ